MWEKVEADGSVYYWNTETDETTWIDPEDPEFESKRQQELDDETLETPQEPVQEPVQEQEPVKEQEPQMTEEQRKQWEEYYNSPEYAQWYHENYGSGYKEYSAAGYFNSKTGKFQSTNFQEKFDSATFFQDTNKGMRLMSQYFDIGSYQEQRTSSKDDEKKRKLTKKEHEYFVKKQKEKKRKNLMAKYALPEERESKRWY